MPNRFEPLSGMEKRLAMAAEETLDVGFARPLGCAVEALKRWMSPAGR